MSERDPGALNLALEEYALLRRCSGAIFCFGALEKEGRWRPRTHCNLPRQIDVHQYYGPSPRYKYPMFFPRFLATQDPRSRSQ